MNLRDADVPADSWNQAQPVLSITFGVVKQIKRMENSMKQLTARQARTLYRIKRRQGYARGAPAINAVRSALVRLTGAFAVMEASDWKANPLLLASHANHLPT